MTITAGSRLGVYDLTALIGEGGMGRVYKARDTKLDRDVAIKILPEAFAHDADRLARFQREAKTLAALRIASCKEVSRSGTRSFGSVSGAHPGVEWEGGGSTHRVEGEVGIEVVRDGIELQEKDGEEQA